MLSVRLFFRQIFLYGIFLFQSILFSQINVLEATRLHFAKETKYGHLLEGYSKILIGTYAPYQSHLSKENRDSAYVARTLPGESAIEWVTAPVPLRIKVGILSFIWACGFGSNLGNDEYECIINDSLRLTFYTRSENYWIQTFGSGISLSFIAMKQNANGANLGYMILSVSDSLLEPLIPVKIRIQGKPAQRENWYRLFAYNKIIENINKDANTGKFSAVRLGKSGEVEYSLGARVDYSNKKIVITTSGKIIADGVMKREKGFSFAAILIPREVQPQGSAVSLVSVNNRVIDTIFWKDINKSRILSFMNEKIVFDKYVFPPGNLPAYRWQDTFSARSAIGNTELNAVFYNSNFEKITRADKPGSYYAVITGRDLSGFEIGRYQTLYCAKAEFDDYSRSVPVALNYLKEWGIDSSKWKEYINNIADYSFGDLKFFPQNSPDAAVFLSGLNEMDTSREWNETPRIRDRDKWIKLKNLINGHSDFITLKKKSTSESSKAKKPNLTEGDIFNYDKFKLQELKTLCEEWAKKSGVPNVTLISHKGKIVFHQAFNTDDAEIKVTINSKLWMASITKLLTGVLVMQFADQGLLDLDKPIYQYLPETGKQYKNIVTTRQLMNHTSGLHLAGEWASDWNTALDNQVGQLMPYVQSGEEFGYNRVGYALTGKILERMTDRAVPYLMRDYIFEPLGMTSAFCDNTYGGLYCTASDLAKLGQMLLNKGTYNGYELFSEDSFNKMLPVKLPFGDRYWGVGTSPMNKYGLSATAFGHGAASGTIFCVDPENELIIISARNTPGEHHSDYEKKLIEKCISIIKNQ